MTKKKTAVSVSYEVLIPCRNDKTGIAYIVGDTVKPGDFTTGVIQNWLAMTPPVLKVKKDGSD